MKRFLLLAGAFLLAFCAHAQQAPLTIDITTTGGRQIPIAIMPLAGEAAQPQSVSEVVGADLSRSGLFRLVPTQGVSPIPTEPSEVNFGDWTARNAEALVIGRIQPMPD